jgi:hypothetical protein
MIKIAYFQRRAFMFSNSGSYEPQISKDHRVYYTFTPKLFSDLTDNAISIDDELTSLLSKAHRFLGILEGRYVTIYTRY